MNSGDDDLSPPYISSYPDGPYSSSLSSSASSSSASVWSDAASQSSDDSSVTSGGASDSEVSDAYSCATRESSYQADSCDVITPTACWPKSVLASIVPTQRRHPRRTSTRNACRPSLVRQCDRKVNFVDSLVGKITKSPEISNRTQFIIQIPQLKSLKRYGPFHPLPVEGRWALKAFYP